MWVTDFHVLVACVGAGRQPKLGGVEWFDRGDAMKLGIGRSLVGAAIAASVALALSGCGSSPPPAAAVAPAANITVDQLVGKWGLASYHVDADRARTEKAAAAQCNKPYVIAKGENGGVMMYLADETKASELVVKPSADGRTYIGPAGPAGDQTDREVVSASDRLFITKWVDPDVAGRYGTMVYARCGAK
jgi:hypothetical protein